MSAMNVNLSPFKKMILLLIKPHLSYFLFLRKKSWSYHPSHYFKELLKDEHSCHYIWALMASHLSDQAYMDSSGHGWNFVTASLPGLSPCDRSSWSWKQWQAPGARSSARRQWHTRTLLFFPTHLLACMFSKIHNINTSYREKQRKNHFNEGFLGYFSKARVAPLRESRLRNREEKSWGFEPSFPPFTFEPLRTRP